MDSSPITTKEVGPFSGVTYFGFDDDEAKDQKLFLDVWNSIREWRERRREKEERAAKISAGDGHVLSRKRRDEEVVCYGDLGCFRDEGPFNYLDMVPSPPQEVGTKIILFTR